MHDTVRLTYSAYEARLKILINNNPVSQYSPLVQFMNEPLYRWCDNIFDYIDGEIEGNYVLEYVGRQEEFEIVSYFADKHSYCKGKTFNDYPADSTVLQKRMSELSRIIKSVGLPVHQSILRTAFFVASSAKDIIPMIDELDVANNFCRIETNIKTVSDAKFNAVADDCNFLITRTPEFVLEAAGRMSVSDYAFILLLGKRQRLTNIENKVYVYETTEEGFYSSVFTCFLLYPLADEFRDCCNKILLDSAQTKIHASVSNLLTTDCRIVVELDKQIELGTSTPLKVKTIPLRNTKPILSFSCMPEGIIECSPLMIRGVKEGSTEICIFVDGDSRPVLKKQIKVVRRNRIQSLLLSETSAYIGEGDELKLDVSFSPENADNSRFITWSSDNSAIATVDNNGRIKARQCGHCRITCSAEKVSSVCTVYIRPYAVGIDISPEPCDGIFIMQPNTSIQLHCDIVPENAIDAQLHYESSDSYIANIINGEITARQEGIANILIYNNEGRIKKQVAVLVESSTKERKKAKSFFRMIGTYIKSILERS